MATINFCIKGKNELVQIYIRVKDGRKADLTAKTDLYINSNYWSEAKGQIKQTAKFTDKLNLDKKLSDLKTKVDESLKKEKIEGKELTKLWLNHCINVFHNKVTDESSLLVELFKNHQKELETRLKPVAKGTINGFSTSIGHLEKFEKYVKSRIHVQKIDSKFLEAYTKFLNSNEGYSMNTIQKDVSRIKQVCQNAKTKGFLVNDFVLSKKFSSSREKSTIVTLTEQEINAIREFKGTDYLENSRDWLIIGCWTGCRVDDLLHLTKDNIMTPTEGNEFIRYTQSKTKKVVDVTLHPHVKEILTRLNGFPRLISDVNFNLYIKELCKRVGFNYEVYGAKRNHETNRKEVGTFPKYELITSHICRRSFATNHYKKLSNKMIMYVTGHATESQLLAYIGEVNNDHLEDYEKLYSKQVEEQKEVRTLNKLA